MKMDIGYINELLEELEEANDWLVIGPDDSDTGDDAVQRRSYHFLLLEDAGYLVCLTPKDRRKSLTMAPFRMTYQGHEYINVIRDQEIWQKTKSAVIETGGSATLEIVKALATGFVKKQLEEKTGLVL